jgi:hypothetical protein
MFTGVRFSANLMRVVATESLYEVHDPWYNCYPNFWVNPIMNPCHSLLEIFLFFSKARFNGKKCMHAQGEDVSCMKEESFKTKCHLIASASLLRGSLCQYIINFSSMIYRFCDLFFENPLLFVCLLAK